MQFVCTVEHENTLRNVHSKHKTFQRANPKCAFMLIYIPVDFSSEVAALERIAEGSVNVASDSQNL